MLKLSKSHIIFSPFFLKNSLCVPWTGAHTDVLGCAGYLILLFVLRIFIYKADLPSEPVHHPYHASSRTDAGYTADGSWSGQSFNCSQLCCCATTNSDNSVAKEVEQHDQTTVEGY